MAVVRKCGGGGVPCRYLSTATERRQVAARSKERACAEARVSLTQAEPGRAQPPAPPHGRRVPVSAGAAQVILITVLSISGEVGCERAGSGGDHLSPVFLPLPMWGSLSISGFWRRVEALHPWVISLLSPGHPLHSARR